MIEYEDYIGIIDPLLARFRPKENMVECLKIDYDNLKYHNPEVLKQAVAYILENHRSYEYPNLSEFIEALEICYEQKENVEHQTQCYGCLDTGFAYDPLKEVAYFCSCEAGIRKRAAFYKYRETKNTNEARKAYNSADVSNAKKNKPVWEKVGRFISLTADWNEELLNRMKERKNVQRNRNQKALCESDKVSSPGLLEDEEELQDIFGIEEVDRG